jgi:hypothetical protein
MRRLGKGRTYLLNEPVTAYGSEYDAGTLLSWLKEGL